MLERSLEYAGFTLDRAREPLPEPFPTEWAEQAHEALAEAALSGGTGHPHGQRLAQLAGRLDEYWRRSGGTLASVSPTSVRASLKESLAGVSTWAGFLNAPLALRVNDLIPAEERARLDQLPDVIGVSGGQARLRYEVEQGRPVVYVVLKEPQLRRVRTADVPRFDRPRRFELWERSGRRLRADTVEELRRQVGDSGRRRRMRAR